jgi:hypothetical protein
MRDFYNHNELDYYLRNRSAVGIAGVIAAKLVHIWFFYLGPLLTLPFAIVIVTLPRGFSWRSISSETRFLAAAAIVSFSGLAGEVFFFPHYAAPLTGLIWALLVAALRRVYWWQSNGRPTGQFLVRALPVGCVLLLALRAAAGPLRLPLTPDWPPAWYNGVSHLTDRARILAQLEAFPGPQLVIVHYAPHPKGLAVTLPEWVHNAADIDRAKVVWAQDMGAAGNRELVDYYKNRQVWLVEPDASPPRLIPYHD